MRARMLTVIELVAGTRKDMPVCAYDSVTAIQLFMMAD